MPYLFFICSIFLLFSCTAPSKEKPPIPLEKMTRVMTDIYIAEVQAAFSDSSRMLMKEKNEALLQQSYASILAHHQLSFEDFKEAYEWYIIHPQLMDTLYKDMLATNDSLQKAYDKIIPEHTAEGLEQSIQKGIQEGKTSLKENEVQKDIQPQPEKSILRPDQKD